MVKLFALIFSLLFFSQSLFAEVRAQLAPNPAYIGDQISLVIEANNIQDNVQPDLSVLEDQFQVLGQSSSQQIQVINGRRSDKHVWTIRLLPLTDGTLQVPEINVGNEKTKAISLTLREVPKQLKAQINKSVLVTTEILDADKPKYVQQELKLVTRLFYNEKLLEGSLSEIEINNTVVEKLGKDLHYRTEKTGIPYQVIERRYSVFPEKSGTLRIPPVVLQGKIATGRQTQRPRRSNSSVMEQFFGQDPFQSRDPGRAISQSSKAIEINIKPRPTNYTGRHWLPAKELEIRDSWTSQVPIFETGKPVKRVITIVALGLAATQIPELEISHPQHFRVYTDSPEITSRTDGKTVIAEYRQTITYIPSIPRQTSIDAINVDWWNTDKNQQEKAVLPGWQFNVSGEEVLAAVPPSETANSLPKDTVETNDQIATTANVNSEVKTWPDKRMLVLIMSLLILSIFTLLYRHTWKKPTQPNDQPSDRHLLNELQQACVSNNAHKTASILLKLAQLSWPNKAPVTLGELGQHLPSQKPVLRTLDEALYADHSNNWKGSDLWPHFKNGLPTTQATTSKQQNLLDPLYHGH